MKKVFLQLESAEIWKPDLQHLFHYPKHGGYDRTKEALIPYIETFFGAKVAKENLIFSASCTALYDMLAFCICDPGGIILVILTIQKWKSKNCKEHSMKMCLRHNLYVIIDEIFASSIHCNEEKFDSVLKFRKSLNKFENIIWIWGLSKDLCMPGAKLAVTHCENKKILECLERLEIFQPSAPVVQDFFVNLFSDLGKFFVQLINWLKSFQKRNVERLREHYELTKMALDKMGIPLVPATAGFFVYCNFSEYLSEDTFTAEVDFYRKLCDEGVYLSLGRYFADPKPGWMRLVFSVDKPQLLEGPLPLLLMILHI
ncbi:unnamed protein product [Anisakis simplex]|uniref:Aminotran_1_2 domain-containing protein n=1 Tax=Anisakis simplex TaxID=6269 RepID=A0A0M3K1B4_ANISI|nr:unnamed protein product [Anisakis simplex]